jgi:hypothetical protein
MVLTILLLVCGSASVLGQGGTGRKTTTAPGASKKLKPRPATRAGRSPSAVHSLLDLHRGDNEAVVRAKLGEPETIRRGVMYYFDEALSIDLKNDRITQIQIKREALEALKRRGISDPALDFGQTLRVIKGKYGRPSWEAFGTDYWCEFGASGRIAFDFSLTICRT